MILNDEMCAFFTQKAKEEAQKLGIDISFAVIDSSGNLKYFQRFGKAPLLSIQLVPKKAYTSVIERSNTKDLAPFCRADLLLICIENTNANICLVGGGYPLFVDSKIIGGYGVGGGSENKNIAIAEAVLIAFKDKHY